MIPLLVAAALLVLVIAALTLRASLCSVAFCPRRESVVRIEDGRCTHRAGDVCANAPLGCEHDCVMLSDLAERAS
jgi:hypothetical protein